MKLMRIDKIFDFEKGSLQSSKCVAGNYNFITASADWKTHFEFTHDTEALVFAAAASGSLGRTHYVNGKFVASDLCFILSPKDPINLPVDLQFYHILFNELRNDIVKNTKSGTSKEAIGLASFGKYEIPYLDIVRQTVIKNQLVTSEVTKEKLSTEISHQLNLIKKLRQQILQDAIHGKLVTQDANDEPASKLLERIKAEKEKLVKEKIIRQEKVFTKIKPVEIPFQIPENWIWCRLNDITTLITDGKHGDSNNENNSGYYFLSAKDLQKNEFVYDGARQITFSDFLETHKRTNLQSGDLCVVNTGATIGKTVIAKDNELTQRTTFQKSVAVIKIVKPFISINFIENLIINQTPNLLKTSRGSAINNLLLGDMKSMIVPLPPINEQNRIVVKINKLMKVCDALEKSILQSQDHIMDLLKEAFKEALEPVEQKQNT